MTMISTIPSKSLLILDASLYPANAADVVRAWIAQPEELYRLPGSEKRALTELIGSVRSALVEANLLGALHRALDDVHERQPEVIAARARATAAINAALANPASLCDLSRDEWRSLQCAALETGDRTALDRLAAARNAVRDNHPDLIAAHETVQATLGDSAGILALNRKQWSQLLKAADRISYGFQGQFRNFRTELIAAKTDAIIAHRLDQIPLSETQHLGIYGSFNPDLVAKIEAVIQSQWLIVPRLWVVRNREEMRYKDGIPRAMICPCDAGWAEFHGIPAELERGTTSIICDLRSASLLKLFGLTVFDVNVSPELEAYFRSLEPFPWEQAVGGGGAA